MDNIERVEWFDDRFYKIETQGGCEFYPSVTTVLGIVDKPFLRKWYADLGYEKAMFRSMLAKEKGSRIHDGIAQILERGFVSSEAWNQEDYFQLWNFTKFYESLRPKVICNESIVLSHKVRSAGTLDILAEIKEGTYDTGYAKPVFIFGGTYVIDIKTGGFYPEYHYQTAAYASMAEECNLCKEVRGTMILQTNADTKKRWKLTVRDFAEVQEDYKHFLSALDLYRANGEDRPKIFDMPAELIIEDIYKLNNKEN